MNPEIKDCLYAVLIVILLPITMQSQPDIDATRVVRVLTFNIFHGETVAAASKFDLDLLAKVINDVQPDLVALQEVDKNTNRARHYDLVEELGKRTQLAPLFGKAMSYDGGEYGEGILSKYAFLSTKTHSLPIQDGKEPRAALEAKVVLKSGDTIRFVGTHLDHTKENRVRLNQAKELTALFADDTIPTLLVGDFNADPESETMQCLFKDWQPSINKNTPTYPAINPTVKIDYVLSRPAKRWRVLEARVIQEEIASDHRPVLSVLELLKD